MAPVAPQPEYVYYQRANYNLAAAIALPILCITAVALRLFARRKQKLALKIDDWLTIPALVRQSFCEPQEAMWLKLMLDLYSRCQCCNDSRYVLLQASVVDIDLDGIFRHCITW